MDDLLIIGGGMAGLACAAHAKGRVRLLEKNAGAGRKLLLSGSGRCNITNAVPIREFFSRYGDHSRFVKPALSAVSNTDLIRFFEDRGLALRARDGHVFPDGNVFPDNNVFSDNKIFPETDRARDVLRVLLHACDTAGVTVEYGITVREITRIDGGFRVSSVIGREFSGPQINVDPSVAPHLCGSAASPGFATSHFYSQTNDATNVVLATGGRSYPKTGASGEGYDLAASLGHTIVPPRPALAPVYVRHYRLAGCAGHAIRGAEVALYRAGKKIRSRTGDVLLTHHGLSGPAVLDLSRFVEPGDILRFSSSAHRSFMGRVGFSKSPKNRCSTLMYSSFMALARSRAATRARSTSAEM